MSLSGLYSQRLPTVLTVLGLARAGRARIRTIGAGSIWALDDYPLPWERTSKNDSKTDSVNSPVLAFAYPLSFPSQPSGATP